MTNSIVIMTTFANVDTGKKIVEFLLAHKLAACIQTWPIKSSYYWKDQINSDEENIMLIKTQSNHYKEIESAILNNHDYELPEIICYNISDGYSSYLDWIASVTK